MKKAHGLYPVGHISQKLLTGRGRWIDVNLRKLAHMLRKPFAHLLGEILLHLGLDILKLHILAECSKPP